MVGDAERGEDVEVILCLVAVQNDRAGLIDEVRGVDRCLGYCHVGGAVRGEVQDRENRGDENGDRQNDGNDKVPAGGLGKGKIGHVSEDSSGEVRWMRADFATLAEGLL